MINDYLLYTTLLVAYVKEQDLNKKAQYKYRLTILKELGLRPLVGDNK